jgi:hypothetical protein
MPIHIQDSGVGQGQWARISSCGRALRTRRLCSTKEAVGITKRLAWPRECISGMPRTPLQHNECHSGIYGPAPPLDNATAAAQLPMMTMQTI